MFVHSHVLRNLEWQNQGPCYGTGGCRRLLNVEVQVRSQARPYGICGDVCLCHNQTSHRQVY